MKVIAAVSFPLGIGLMAFLSSDIDYWRLGLPMPLVVGFFSAVSACVLVTLMQFFKRVGRKEFGIAIGKASLWAGLLATGLIYLFMLVIGPGMVH